MKRIVSTLAATLAAGTILAGCTTVGAEKQTVDSAPGNTAPAATEETKTASDSDADTDTDTIAAIGVIGEGEWFTYADGIQVQVTSAERYNIGQYAAGGQPGDIGVIVTVVMNNGSDGVFDTGQSDVGLSFGSDGVDADTVFDSSHNLGSGFEGSIVPGRKKTARYAFAVAGKNNLSNLIVEIEPSWDHDSSFFQGKAN